MELESADILRRVALGEMPALEAAQKLGITEEKVFEFIKSREDLKISTKDDEEIPDDTVGMLRLIVKHLNKRVIKIVKLPVDPMSSKMLANEVNALEKVVMDIAKLTHELENTPAIQVNNIKVEAIQLQQLIMGDLCPVCQDKILKILEELEALKLNGKTVGQPILPGPDATQT